MISSHVWNTNYESLARNEGKNMMETMKGLIFNIQRYSIHDGAGIRTIIFLKGCPLACPWCSNPESRKGVAPMTWTKNDRQETIGEWKTVDEIVKEVMRDEIFYRTSGGGVTLSGGEVLLQHEFAKEILKELFEMGIHTAIETTGCFNKERLEVLLPYVNQVLFDLKIMDGIRAKQVIGYDVETVKENFESALTFREWLEVIPRIPLIPEYTTNKSNLQAIVNYLLALNINEVHLLPFHQYGSSKYEYLGWNYKMKDTATLSQEEVKMCQDIFETQGISTIVDGLD